MLRGFVTTFLLAYTLTASAAVGRNEHERRAAELSRANGSVYHLIANCMAGGQNVCAATEREIERNLRALEANSLSAQSAGKYRQARVKIGEGHRHYAQARSATGREQSRLVELGNAAMQIANALLRAAVQLFEGVIRDIRAGQGWSGDDDREAKCRAERQQRERRCEDEYQEEMQEAERLWLQRYEDCARIYRRAIQEGFSKAEAKRQEVECKRNADNERRRKEQQAARNRAACLDDAGERFERCMSGTER